MTRQNVLIVKKQLPDSEPIQLDTQHYMDRTGFMSCVKDGIPMSRMYGSGIAWWCCHCGMVIGVRIPMLFSDRFDYYNVIKPTGQSDGE